MVQDQKLTSFAPAAAILTVQVLKVQISFNWELKLLIHFVLSILEIPGSVGGLESQTFYRK